MTHVWMHRQPERRRHIFLLSTLAFASLACLVYTQQQPALPTASLGSVTTIPICEQEFGTDTQSAQKTTDALCGDAKQQSLTIMRLNINPTQVGGAETFEFNALPPAEDNSNGQQFNNDQPCDQVRSGENCQIFGNQPMSITVSSSPLAVAYFIAPITDNFPIQTLRYSSLAQWSDDDEANNDDGDFDESNLLNPESQYYACYNGYEYDPDDDDLVTRFGGMHDTNGGNYQFQGGCQASGESDPYSLNCKNSDCELTINARAWCTHRLTGHNAKENFITLNGPCKTTLSQKPTDTPWFPHNSLRNDFGKSDTAGQLPATTGCVVCRADYSDNRYMAGLFGNERKCNTFMQDFRQCFVESWRAAYPGQSQNVLCPWSETDADLCSAGAAVDDNRLVCIDAGQGGEGGVQSCVLYTPPQECQQLLEPCNPFTAGTTCWGSYNQPSGFYSVSKGSDPNPGVVQGLLGKRGNERGAAITQFWISEHGGSNDNSGDSWNHGHLYRCGHQCTNMPEIPRPLSYKGNEYKVSTQNQAGYVKGWTGLGPLCKAFAIERRGQIEASITFDVSVSSGGSSKQSSFSVATDETAGGNSVGYDPSVKGVGARLRGPGTVTGDAISDLGGVLVVCGANPVESTSGVTVTPGTINGVLGEDWDVRRNPWPTLVQAVQGAQTDQFSMGACMNGCSMPVAPLITALQCFSCDTASYASPDVCKALKQSCIDNDLECVVPIDFDENNIGTCNCNTCPPSVNGKKIWDGNNQNVPRGVAWMWYPEESLAAFGKGCGQYGMNTATFGKDEATGQFVCSSSGDSVPCVPGVSADAPTAGVPPPCNVLGDMTNFYCRTSSSGGQAGTSSTDCGVLANPRGCGSDEAGQVPLPQGVMPDWERAAPNYWVHKGRIYKTPPDDATITTTADLYVSGAALNADVENVSPGHFVTLGRTACVLQKGSTLGRAFVAVQNTGALTAEYLVEFDGCLGSSGQQEISAVGSRQQTATIASGNTTQLSFQLSVPQGFSFSSVTCTYSLRPAARTSLLLDNRSYGCAVANPSVNLQPGSTGLTPLQASGGELGPDDCIDPGFECWVATGSTFSHVVFFTLLGSMAVMGIVFFIVFARSLHANSKTVQVEKATKHEERMSDIMELAEKKELEKYREKQAEVRTEKALRTEELGLPTVISESIEQVLADRAAPNPDEDLQTTEIDRTPSSTSARGREEIDYDIDDY